MTRLNDYLRAEVPDETEPPSFYVPGSESWRAAKTHSRAPRGGTDDDEVIADPIESTDIQEISENAAVEKAAALHALEG